MSEQNRRINWPHSISPEVPEEMLRMPISVIAHAIGWIGVIGNLQVALRHPQNIGPSRGMVQDFAGQLLHKLVLEKVFTTEQAARAFEDF